MSEASSNIHPSAVVDKKAIIGKNVKIGPFCVVDKNVNLADGVELLSHVVVTGNTKIGPESILCLQARQVGETGLYQST